MHYRAEMARRAASGAGGEFGERMSSRGYGDVEGQVRDVGWFAARLRHTPGPMRWGAMVLVALFVVPLAIAVALGIAELFRS